MTMSIKDLIDRFKAQAVVRFRDRLEEQNVYGLKITNDDGRPVTGDEWFAREWADKWEHGGEYNVQELIMEGTLRYNPVTGESDGPAVVVEGLLLQVVPEVILDMLEAVTHDKFPPDIASYVVRMSGRLYESCGQFMVYRMSQNCEARQGFDHMWLVAYGDFAGVKECDSEEDSEEKFRKLRSGEVEVKTKMVADVMMWSVLRSFIQKGCIREIGRMAVDD